MSNDNALRLVKGNIFQNKVLFTWIFFIVLILPNINYLCFRATQEKYFDFAIDRKTSQS